VPHFLWSVARLGGYVRLSIEERREAVKELTDEGISQREVAEVLGVTQPTVQADLKSDKNLSKKADSNGETDRNLSPAPTLERDEAKERRIEQKQN
jgi:predicted transcriptional regulator